MKISLTDREVDIMQVLWERGPFLVTDVRERLSDKLAYTTVLIVLRTLEANGYAGHAEEGRAHRYFAGVKQQAARKNALRHLTNKLFKSSTKLLFAHLVSDQKLSPEQINRMRKLLSERSDKEKPQCLPG
jgi:predicted transcriptional regulator